LSTSVSPTQSTASRRGSIPPATGIDPRQPEQRRSPFADRFSRCVEEPDPEGARHPRPAIVGRRSSEPDQQPIDALVEQRCHQLTGAAGRRSTGISARRRQQLEPGRARHLDDTGATPHARVRIDGVPIRSDHAPSDAAGSGERRAGIGHEDVERPFPAVR
jgi:hypothetical protein